MYTSLVKRFIIIFIFYVRVYKLNTNCIFIEAAGRVHGKLFHGCDMTDMFYYTIINNNISTYYMFYLGISYIRHVYNIILYYYICIKHIRGP